MTALDYFYNGSYMQGLLESFNSSGGGFFTLAILLSLILGSFIVTRSIAVSGFVSILINSVVIASNSANYLTLPFSLNFIYFFTALSFAFVLYDLLGKKNVAG